MASLTVVATGRSSEVALDVVVQGAAVSVATLDLLDKVLWAEGVG